MAFPSLHTLLWIRCISCTRYRAPALSLAACGGPNGATIFLLSSNYVGLEETLQHLHSYIPSLLVLNCTFISNIAALQGYPWIIRIFGFNILINVVLILVPGQTRKFKNNIRRLQNWGALRKPVNLSFSRGFPSHFVGDIC